MVGSAVAMMVWFSAASSAVSISPKKMVRTSAWLMTRSGGAGLEAIAGSAGGSPASAGLPGNGSAAPGLPGAVRSGPCSDRCERCPLDALPARPRTVARSLERARAAARETFIAAKNPQRTSQCCPAQCLSCDGIPVSAVRDSHDGMRGMPGLPRRWRPAVAAVIPDPPGERCERAQLICSRLCKLARRLRRNARLNCAGCTSAGAPAPSPCCRR